MKISKQIIPLLAIGAFSFALFSLYRPPAKEENPPELVVPKSQYERNVAGIGVVEPKSELIAIGTELSGVVRTVAIRPGQHVQKGDILFMMDQRDIDAQIGVLTSSLKAAEIQAQDVEAQLEIVSKIKDSRALSQDEFNRKRYAADLAVAKIQEVQAQLDQALTTKARLTVQAPIDGVILEVNIRPGEFAAAGDVKTPLILMGDLSTLHVRTEVDEENAGYISKESLAKGFLRGNPERSIPLQFVRFEPYVKPKKNLNVAGQRVDTRVVQVIYALPQNSEEVYVGRQMDVFIENRQAAQMQQERQP